MKAARSPVVALLLGLALPCIAKAEPPSSAPTGCPTISPDETGQPAPGLVDLNRADEQALLGLPGIGPARAQAILAYRAAHGGFRSVSQLLQIRGVGRALLKQLRPLVTIGEPAR